MLVERGAAGQRVVRLKGGDPFVFARGRRGGGRAAGGRRAVRGGPRHHVGHRRARLRRHPGHPAPLVDVVHRRHRPRGPGGRATTAASTGTPSPGSAAPSSCSWAWPGSHASPSGSWPPGAPPEHARRRRHVGHPARAAHRAGHARHHRRLAVRDAGHHRHRRGRGSRSGVVRAPTRCSGARSSSPGPACRRGRWPRASAPSAPRWSSCPPSRSATRPTGRGAAGRRRPPSRHTTGWCSRRRTASSGSSPTSPTPACSRGAQVAAIGPGTADCPCRPSQSSPTWCPTAFVAEALLDVVPGRATAACCCPRAAVARDVLPDGLRAKGWHVDVVEAYRTRPAEPSPALLDAAGRADAVTFTSSSTVEQFVAIAGRDRVPPVVACIGTDHRGHGPPARPDRRRRGAGAHRRRPCRRASSPTSPHDRPRAWCSTSTG